MSMSKPTQQLQMLLREDVLVCPPELRLPSGYTLHTYRPEDAAGYIDLMHLAGFAHWDPNSIQNALQSVLPNGLFVIEHESGTLVATAMAGHHPSPHHPFGGELGWVAGHPDHGRRGLGVAVCAAVIRRYAEAGYSRVYLRTDDFRLPAIKSYLKLGFVPFLHDEDMRDRWRAVCEKLDWPFEPDEWPSAESAPPQIACVGRPNADSPDRYQPRRKWLPHRPHRAYPGGGDMDAFSDESLYKPSQLGSAYAEPVDVEAGSESTLRIMYTAGPGGLPGGTVLSLAIRGQSPLGRRMGECEVEQVEGCTLRADGRGFVVEQGTLEEGRSVALVWKSFEWTPLAGRREFKVVLRFPDGVAEQRLPEPVAIDIKPRKVDRLEALLPCTHRPGESLRLHVTARDTFDNRVPLEGVVAVADGSAESPELMTGGMCKCEVGAPHGEVVRVKARLSSPRLESDSNPSIPSEDYQLYVGDLHAHDFLSEAEGYPDQVYRWAMEDRRLDFVSVVPQSHGWHDNETWTVTKYMNERFLREGGFVTLLGFEWQHTGYGDKVIHFLGGDQPYLPADDPRYCTPEGLYKALRESDATVISHHPSYPVGKWCPATDYDAIETDMERVVELWSMHGSSEGYDPSDRPLVSRSEEHTAMAALRQGVRLGFVAGSDTHSARPGGSAKEPLPYWGGLAAIWAKDLTRRSIFEAIRARRTYALTRARIVARMTVNGAWMGSEIPASDKAHIRIQAWAPGKIAKVEIMKNALVLKEFGPFGDECTIEYEDATGGPAFYHCRITQTDGELAVCSPVWVG